MGSPAAWKNKDTWVPSAPYDPASGAAPNEKDYYTQSDSITAENAKAQFELDTESYQLHTGTYQTKEIDRNDSQYAAKTMAELAKDQYSDYKERFEPYDKKLLGLVDSTEMLDKQLSRISSDTVAATKRKKRIRDTLNSRLGISTSALQSQSIAREDGAASALALAQAKNNTRIATSDLQDSILTGSSGRSVLSTLQEG